MIVSPRTYREVAEEIVEGLQSGQIVLESEPTMDEMGLLAGLVFQYFVPKRVAFVLGAASSAGIAGRNPHVMMQIDPRDYENLPEEAKISFRMKIQELTNRGVKIKFKDLHGNIFYLFDHASAMAPPEIRKPSVSVKRA